MIALEPEAAAICCLEKNMSEFQSETGCRSVEGLLSQPNTHYMVVDIGGKYFSFLRYVSVRSQQNTPRLCSSRINSRNSLPGGEKLYTKLQVL